jgi:DNA repair protein RadC
VEQGDPGRQHQSRVEQTSEIDGARPLGIAVHDHIIVDKDGHASLEAIKLI